MVGAGTAGLAVAAFLKQDGHDVTIFERFTTPRPFGAGLLLQPTGLAILATLGLDQAAIVQAAPIHHLYGKAAPHGRVIFDISYAGLVPHLHGLGIHRGTLFSLLHGKAMALGVPLQTGITITGLNYDHDERPILTDATSTEHGPFDLVIDAHGIRSCLRAQHARLKLDKPYPYGAVWGVCRDVEGIFPHDTLSQRYYRAKHMIGVLPLGRLNGDTCQSVAFFWSLRVDACADWRVKGMDAWRQQVIALWPETAGLLAQFATPDDLTLATYSDVILRHPCATRLAFIGDAAHCTSPQLGQGANLALVDAWTLAAALREQPDIEVALEAYARARKRHVRFYQLASRWLTPFFQSDNIFLSLVRDWTFGPLCKVPFMRIQMLQTLAGIKTGPLTKLNPARWHPAYDTRKHLSKAAIE